ncbi:VOC family protein [Streptomyces sp. SID3343]|uniref:VOC family protein n=1 Tax=Streptomyces sp. SID3343 TaxID=2690260 RepID=UPI00136C43B8|nr:VOC family protein [Streptomyces sp. SID3343]MYW05894.1 glyoxalase [Streptomyces sp. SID3343]
MGIKGQAVVHFEIVGTDPAMLRDYYGKLFGWEFDVGDAATEAISEPGNYGFVDGAKTDAGGGNPGINGGVAGGADHERRVLFYVGVPSVEAALRKAESLGGTRTMGPEPASAADFAVGHFTDPEGHLIGVAGPA